MESDPLKPILEALIFAADEPISVNQLEEILNEGQVAGQARTVSANEIRQFITELNAEYGIARRAYRILQVGGGYQFATRPEFAEWVGRLYKERGKRKLSHSALETLAIIAYRQPVTKPEIEAIRGVNADYVLHTLLERRLVTITGRAQTVGRPLLYGTTNEFLKHFGINDLTDLPKPRELEELMEEQKAETGEPVVELPEETLPEPRESISTVDSSNERSQLEISPDGLIQAPNPDEPPNKTDENKGESVP
jgi:segregation and condensation protein B